MKGWAARSKGGGPMRCAIARLFSRVGVHPSPDHTVLLVDEEELELQQDVHEVLSHVRDVLDNLVEQAVPRSLRHKSPAKKRSCSFILGCTRVGMYMMSMSRGSDRHLFRMHYLIASISSSVPCCVPF